MRGLAALGVAICHYSYYFVTNYYLRTIFNDFFVGVSLFLMLSMYLLLHRLDSNPDLKHYFKRRILRIWPIYYGVVILTYLYFHYDFTSFILLLFFVDYYVNPNSVYPIYPLWTLQLEEAMYVVIAFIHKLSQKRKLYLAYVMIIFGSAYTLTAPYNDTLFHLIPLCLVSYGVGLLAFCGKIPKISGKVGLVGFLTLVAMDLMSPTTSFFLAPQLRILTYIAISFGFGSLLVNPPKFLSKFTVLGEESYALYAIHYPFIPLFGDLGLPLSIIAAFFIELATRPRTFIARLKHAYSTKHLTGGEG